MGGIEQTLFELIKNWYLATGLVGIVLAMALESCCIPLPSEIVMPLAGYMVFKYPDHFSLIGVGLAGALGCVIGSAVAYWIGASGGRPLLLKYGRYILVSKADSDRADRWFARYGAPVAFFSRLLPVVRTYISLPAGIARMPFGTFIVYTLLGSLPWTFVLALVGLKLGDKIDQASQLGTIFHGLDVVVLVAIVAAAAFYIYRHIKHDRAARAAEAETETETTGGLRRPELPRFPR
ncbi:MAG TPA: DedA family protein [Ktedonobacterales bacterium]|nr:DedA family protein [Ktedonobacterales bacterium]